MAKIAYFTVNLCNFRPFLANYELNLIEKGNSDVHENWGTAVFRCALQDGVAIFLKKRKKRKKIQVFALIHRLIQKP